MKEPQNSGGSRAASPPPAEMREAVRCLLMNPAQAAALRRELAGRWTAEEWQAYIREERERINGDNAQLLEALCDRVAAAQRVAAARFLSGESVHREDRELKLLDATGKRAQDHLNNLIAEQGQVHLTAADVKDVVFLALNKAKQVQNRCIDEFAAVLAANKMMMDASVADSERAFLIPPYSDGEFLLVREPLDLRENRIRATWDRAESEPRMFLQQLDGPLGYVSKGILHYKHFELFAKAMERGEQCVAVCGFAPIGRMHLGHAALVRVLAQLQRLGVQIVIPMGDIEARFRHGLSEDEIAANAREYGVHLAALGIDLEAADIYRQTHRAEVMRMALELGASQRLTRLIAAFGVHVTDSATALFYPAVQMADILHVQLPERGGRRPTVVCSGIDQHIYLDFARDAVAHGDGSMMPPCGLFVRFLKALRLGRVTERPSDKMTVHRPAATLFLDEDAETVERKVRRAFVGGRASREEQQRLGGEPDMRICPVSSLRAFHVDAADEYETMVADCRAGGLLCADCKARALEGIRRCLQEHQQRVRDMRSDAGAVLEAKGL